MTRWTRDHPPTPAPLPDGEHDEAALAPDAAAELGDALRAAWSPSPLDPAVERALLEAALTDPVAPSTPAEAAAAAALGDALDGRSGAHRDQDGDALALAVALRAAFAPDPPAPAAIERALAAALRSRPEARGQRLPRRVALLGLGAAAGALALAAAVALTLTAPGPGPGRPLPHVSRSTAALFEARFELGQTSARIDRIAVARERELRDNRFAHWGVP